jgi:AraC-like DNA-binding protein
MKWAIQPHSLPSFILKRQGSKLCDPMGRDIIRLAEENNFSVSKVADILGLRVYQFKAALERACGMGPKELFRHHRAVMARWMISEGSGLRLISDKLGFRYYTHFAAEIRSFYGIPPRELQRILRAKNPQEMMHFQALEGLPNLPALPQAMRDADEDE